MIKPVKCRRHCANLREVLVGQLGVLCQQARRDVVVLVLAVQQEQVAERLGWVGRVGDEVRELLEGARGILVCVDESLQQVRSGQGRSVG